ncbi:MAG: hypothetical protein E7425_14645 [Ruminococcaceae bacterium]|nr:hypothetical protein [Oscillospiraceae bacterium]
MDALNTALRNLGVATSSGRVQYNVSVAKKAMLSEAVSAVRMFDMLPSQRQLKVRGPQPGDTPAIRKGSFFDTYA